MGYSKSVTTKDWKYLSIRYPQHLLERGFEPPETGTTAHHQKIGSFSMLPGKHEGSKTPMGQARGLGLVDMDQLYHLKKDPQEGHNLARHPEFTEKLKQMKALLSQKIALTERPFGEF